VVGLPWAADSCPWVGKLRTVLPSSDVTRDSAVQLVLTHQRGLTRGGSCAAVTQWMSAVGRGLGELGSCASIASSPGAFGVLWGNERVRGRVGSREEASGRVRVRGRVGSREEASGRVRARGEWAQGEENDQTKPTTGPQIDVATQRSATSRERTAAISQQ
jgi:hypothetical protein